MTVGAESGLGDVLIFFFFSSYYMQIFLAAENEVLAFLKHTVDVMI